MLQFMREHESVLHGVKSRNSIHYGLVFHSTEVKCAFYYNIIELLGITHKYQGLCLHAYRLMGRVGQLHLFPGQNRLSAQVGSECTPTADLSHSVRGPITVYLRFS